MTSMLSRAIAAVRVWLGFNDPSENHPHQAHGWLLPPLAVARARRTAASTTSATGVDPSRGGAQK
jgi:hypothetical protein